MTVLIFDNGLAIDLKSVQYVGPPVVDGQGKTSYTVYLQGTFVRIDHDQDFTQAEFVNSWTSDLEGTLSDDDLDFEVPKTDEDAEIQLLMDDLDLMHGAHMALLQRNKSSRLDFLSYLKKATQTFKNYMES